MNKKLVVGTAAGCAAVVAAVAAKKCTPESGTTKWDRMRQRMEEMPEDFPPRMMFDNVAATKANTEQILALLSTERQNADDPVTSG